MPHPHLAAIIRHGEEANVLMNINYPNENDPPLTNQGIKQAK